MRLLHLNESRNYLCTDFTGKTIPPYAILSHRWSHDEVLFEDVTQDQYHEKPGGYNKLAFCAEQALRDGLRYFWIDTCCIDKNNRVELSRAVNSMFAWYKAAARCYVYLSDVSVPSSEDAKQLNKWKAAFQASEWHARGWTLQELIAPRSVNFFSREGYRLGNKVDLAALLTETTGIPVPVLLGRSLETTSADARIAWGERRTTTEPEDAAYCLLGILEVYMPLSYGEGKSKAMQRLLSRLNKMNAPSTIPFSRHDYFVGRESELVELQSKLSGGGRTPVVGIVGAGGLGKTQLALELLYRLRDLDKSCALFWIDAGDRESFLLGCSEIARLLQVTGWDDPNMDAGQLVKLHLESENAGSWVVVWDNVESINLGSASLVDYLPRSRSNSGSVVFTTTENDTAEALAPQFLLELEYATAGGAREMMMERCGPRIASTREQSELEPLIEELNYLPLAIVQAAAYLKNTSSSMHRYRQRLAAEQQRLNETPRDGTPDTAFIERTVAATLTVSLERLALKRPFSKREPLAVEYLSIAACVDRKNVPFELLGPPSSERSAALKILQEYEMITRRPEASSFDLHRLVHLAMQRWLRSRGSFNAWVQETTRRLAGIFPACSGYDRSKWRRLLPHATLILSHDVAEEDDINRTWLTGRLASAFHLEGRYQEAGKMYLQVFEINKRKLGEDDIDTLAAMHNLARTYVQLQRLQEAEELATRLVDTSNRGLGEEDPTTLGAVIICYDIYLLQGRYREVEELATRSVATFEEVFGKEHPTTLLVLDTLAQSKSKQGKFQDAEDLSVRLVDTWKRMHGEQHSDTLRAMDTLASTYYEQGKYREAELLYARIVEIMKTVLGEGHIDTFHATDALVSTYCALGKYRDAGLLAVRGLETKKRVLGEEHPDTLLSMYGVAYSWMYDNRRDEAMALLTECVRLQRCTLGDRHPDTVRSKGALDYWKSGHWTMRMNHPDAVGSI